MADGLRAPRRRVRSTGVELVGDDASRPSLPGIGAATDDDFGREFLDLKMSVAVVDDLDGAIDHVNRFGTGHTEAILTRDLAPAGVSPTRSTPPRWSSTPRPASSTARSSASAPRSVSPRRSCTPAGPMGLRELTTSSTSSWATGRCGVTEHGRRPRRQRVRTTSLAEARFDSIAAVLEGLRGVDYLADNGIAGVVYLADRLGKPVLVEGPAGTARPSWPRRWPELTGSRLIRLQCYEGLDESKAIYEWNYKKQLLRIQADREHERDWRDRSRTTSSPRSSCSPGRCSRRSAPRSRSCC